MNQFKKNLLLKLTRFIPDKMYLCIMYRFVTKKKLHLNPPVSFNEKMQWLKLFYRKNIFTKMVDKIQARKYIADHVGSDNLVPLLGVWESFDDIDFDKLPDKFVLKCNHDCEGIVICSDKSTFDFAQAKKTINAALSRNFYYQGREWPYKNVRPLILCEQYLSDSGSNQLTDYKIFNFNGEPFCIQVDYDRFIEHKRQFFDVNWNRMDVSFHFKSDTKYIKKPDNFDQMLKLARQLSSGFPHLRTDFYVVGSKIYIGELTFFHGTGMGRWEPESFDYVLGEKLILPEKVREDKKGL